MARLAAMSGAAAPPATTVGGVAVLPCSRAPSGAGCWRPSTVTPAVARIRAAAMATSGFGRAGHFIWITPSARAATATRHGDGRRKYVTNRYECEPIAREPGRGIGPER